MNTTVNLAALRAHADAIKQVDMSKSAGQKRLQQIATEVFAELNNWNEEQLPAKQAEEYSASFWTLVRLLPQRKRLPAMALRDQLLGVVYPLLNA
ncbi:MULTISPECIES: hypothetical protein [Hymenobacter]|uniref:Uncharacterized protein n=1 Tax=Hymenobacter jejuensis TaxID=2502781 RepID=A0A5B8A4Q5_9BACT|nr:MULTISPECIES: hypothetical protein [Hymenobacter]MBC6989544.1 hypothetical protein [Hymenobacter sp. BT491]QDA61565.1 hypothetical protein FHG12_16315 [Hymenobacter jejuensis]